MGSEMSEKQTKKKKRNHTLTFLWAALVVIMVPFLFNSVSFVVKKIKLENEKSELVQMINEEAEQKILYEEELEKVGTPEYYEYLARKYLGYIYPDETILVVEDNDEEDSE
jgi:cell division protein FtsB